jgi:hypothetical protein
MRIQMKSLIVVTLLAVVFTTIAPEAFAQRAGGKTRAPMQFSFTYGSMWGGNIDTGVGKLRTGTGGSMGFALDVPIRPGMSLEASYTRQESSLDWDQKGSSLRTLTDMTVNVWHLGTLRDLAPPTAKVIPYVQGSLGATFMSPSASEAVIDGETYTMDGTTKFSIAFGAGFKTFFGESQRVGLRGLFKVTSTIFDSSGGVYFGTGGAGLGISGYGIWQYEFAGGVVVKFGG